MKNIYRDFLEKETGNAGLVIATVVETIGSAPQKPGSSALFDSRGLESGTVGGGVVEGQVQAAAKSCSVSGESVLLHFTLGNDISNKYEAICGGRISVLVDANPRAHLPVFRNILNSISENTSGVLITMVTPLREDTVLINRYWMSSFIRPQIPAGFMDKIEPEVMDMIKSPVGGEYRKLEIALKGEEPSSFFFLELLKPPDRLIIAGAGHIGRALSHLGRMLDFEVTVIDDREDYANVENIPDAHHIVVKDIGEAMQEVRKDEKTYIVIVTRGHYNDAEALKPCIGSGAAYIGMIGSRAKTVKIRDEFILNKWASEEQWDRIYTPIGLEIGSKTVEEIAVSIAAQLVLTRNKKN